MHSQRHSLGKAKDGKNSHEIHQTHLRLACVRPITSIHSEPESSPFSCPFLIPGEQGEEQQRDEVSICKISCIVQMHVHNRTFSPAHHAMSQIHRAICVQLQSQVWTASASSIAFCSGHMPVRDLQRSGGEQDSVQGHCMVHMLLLSSCSRLPPDRCGLCHAPSVPAAQQAGRGLSSEAKEGINMGYSITSCDWLSKLGLEDFPL